MNYFVEAEILSQPDCWTRAVELAGTVTAQLPQQGERVAFVGCGTSWFVGQVLASWRETAGLGESDAFTASEFPANRSYDRIVALTRSGTTTEVLDLLRAVQGKTATTVVTGDLLTPVPELTDNLIDLTFADEKSVVQTRFATATLALFRAAFGFDMAPVIEDARKATTEDLDPQLVAADQMTFVGQGWTVGIANEAALKFRETSSSWAESYPAMDYRHGPISIASAGRAVWSFGEPPSGLGDQVTATGATFVDHQRDALSDLVVAQRVAVARAVQLGLNPDQPRNLTRSVVLAD